MKPADMQRYHVVSGLLFTLVGLMHLWRAIQGWEMQIGPYSVTVTGSYVVFGLCTLMAIWAFASKERR